MAFEFFTNAVKSIMSEVKSISSGNQSSKSSGGTGSTKATQSGKTASTGAGTSSAKNTSAGNTASRLSSGRTSNLRSNLENSNNVRVGTKNIRHTGNTSSIKTLYSDKENKSSGHDREESWQAHTEQSLSTENEKTNSLVSDEDKDEKVNIFKLLYGVGEQGANMVVGDIANALDMFIGNLTRKQWTMLRKSLTCRTLV